MATEKDLELLDDYLANRLGEKERKALEDRLESDKSLQAEYILQRDIIAHVRNARVLELKGMLNNVAVSSSFMGEMSFMSKLGIVAMVAALTGTGIYFSLQSPKETQPVSQEVVQNPENEQPESLTSVPSVEKNIPESVKTEVKEDKPHTTVTKKPRATAEKSTRPNINVLDPTKELESGKGVETNPPTSSPGVVTSSIQVERVVSNKRYGFHYQFKDEKLYLYGPFEDNLYEILEFFNGGKRTAFLFYEKNYYFLEDTSSKITPLTPLKETNLLKKLKEYRENPH